MSTKHTATLPDGTIAKRTSASRVYPFVIAVGPLSVEDWKADLEASAVRAEAQHARYLSIATYLEDDGDLKPVEVKGYGISTTYVHAIGLPFNGAHDERDRHRGIAQLAREAGGYGYVDIATARDSIAAAMRKYAAGAEADAAKYRRAAAAITDVAEWGIWGWTSRPDLATKAAEAARRADPRREVRILDTERVEA